MDMEFPKKLRKLCREKGWSQRTLAAALEDVSPSTISNWSTGLFVPRLDEIRRLAALFEVPIEYLVRDDLDEPSDDGLSGPDREILQLARRLGHERAMSRLLGVPEPAAHSYEQARATSRPSVGNGGVVAIAHDDQDDEPDIQVESGPAKTLARRDVPMPRTKRKPKGK